MMGTAMLMSRKRSFRCPEDRPAHLLQLGRRHSSAAAENEKEKEGGEKNDEKEEKTWETLRRQRHRHQDRHDSLTRTEKADSDATAPAEETKKCFPQPR